MTDALNMAPRPFPVTPALAAKRERKSHLFARHPQDYYVEPHWVSTRLFACERFEGGVIDPACGSGRIVRAAHGAGLWARGSDLVRRNHDERVCAFEADFLSSEFDRLTAHHAIENIVSNPPVKVARAFAEKAISISTRKVALLLPAAWVQGDARSRWLATTPLRKVLFIAPRPSMPPGPVIEAGIPPGAGTTDFAWFIWLRGFDGTPEAGWLRRDA